MDALENSWTQAMQLTGSAKMFQAMPTPLLQRLHHELRLEKNRETASKVWDDHHANAALRTRIEDELGNR